VYKCIFIQIEILKYSYVFIRYYNSFLLNIQFSVKINDNTSDLMHISAGVTQGSKLSPIPFNIYVSDIPESHPTNIALFTDDTTIFTESTKIDVITTHLQTHIDTLSHWCESKKTLQKHRRYFHSVSIPYSHPIEIWKYTLVAESEILWRNIRQNINLEATYLDKTTASLPTSFNVIPYNKQKIHNTQKILPSNL